MGPLEDEGTAVIPANLAASHVGEYATVEGVVAKVFTSKSGNMFLNIGATYPNQTFTDWIPIKSVEPYAMPSTPLPTPTPLSIVY